MSVLEEEEYILPNIYSLTAASTTLSSRGRLQSYHRGEGQLSINPKVFEINAYVLGSIGFVGPSSQRSPQA